MIRKTRFVLQMEKITATETRAMLRRLDNKLKTFCPNASVRCQDNNANGKVCHRTCPLKG